MSAGKHWAYGQAVDGSWLIQGDPLSFQAPWVYQEGTVAALPPKPESEANARLIAAAPDLLAACRLVLRASIACPEDLATEVEACREAIAKAAP